MFYPGVGGGGGTPTPYVIADYANINSNSYLQALTLAGHYYGYECTEFIYNGVTMPTFSLSHITSVSSLMVPVQISPKITIPDHTVLGVEIDYNWIDFLEQLLMPTPMIVSPSPFDPDKDANYPTVIRNAASIITGLTPHNYTYGEGFSLDKPQPDTFSIRINFLVNNAVVHQMRFTEAGYYFNGAFVQAPQNSIVY